MFWLKNIYKFASRLLTIEMAIVTFLPALIVAGGCIVKIAAGKEMLPGLGNNLAALGLGQILPFVVFESLLTGKILSMRATYQFFGSTLTVKYPVSVQHTAGTIEKLRVFTLLIFIGCFLVWIAAVSFSANLASGKQYSGLSLALGCINCLIAWSYLVFV